MQDKIKVLSIDGGGTRGILAAVVLTYIEKTTNKKICDMFGLIAGTSTGGLIAGLLSIGYSAEDILKFYLGDEAKKIFSPFFIPFIRGYKYPSKNINNLLNEKFGEKTFKDCLIDIILTSYDTETRNSIFFYSKNKRYNDLYLRDMIRATTAAPTYFEPHNFNGFTCIDGGIFANNPSMCAYTEAKKQYPYKEVFMVSLGTGSYTEPLHYKDINNWNPLQWIGSLIGCIFDGQSDTVEHQMKYLLNKDNYYRFQVKLPKESNKIDDPSDKEMCKLYNLANKYISEDWNKQLENLCSQL